MEISCELARAMKLSEEEIKDFKVCGHTA